MIDGPHVIRMVAALAIAVAFRPLQAQQPVRVPMSVLARYEGEYVYPNGNMVTVRLRGGTLYREIPGQQVALVPISETVFRLGPVFTAEFVIDQAGGVTQIVSDGVGVEYRLRRKFPMSRAVPRGASPDSAAADVHVPRSVLERYVGVYEFLPGQMSRTDLRIVVRLAGDTLIRDMGAGEAVLVPISETRFRVANTSLTVEFVVDDAGVTQVLGSGFQQMLARLKSKR